MRRFSKTAMLAAGLAIGVGGLSGCRDSSDEGAAKEAQKALGVESTKEVTTSDVKRDVLVIEEKKVVDAKTGETVGTPKKTVTPVTVETKVKKDVDVRTGEAQVSPPKK